MQLWTTFCPRKICWEVTYSQSSGQEATSGWVEHKGVIQNSLKYLYLNGFTGIRLVIFNFELSSGKTLDFHQLEWVVDQCKKYNLLVDLCLGPFQYPHYPGFRLPDSLLPRVFNQHYLDDDPLLAAWGLHFFTRQLKRYGKDPRIHGFYLGNEWPDWQRMENKEEHSVNVSSRYMQTLARIAQPMTRKPITMNTNIDCMWTWKIQHTFQPFKDILGTQFRLGLDIYPSQETWHKVPFVKVGRFVISMDASIHSLQNWIGQKNLVVTEYEAQPWGAGEPWVEVVEKNLYDIVSPDSYWKEAKHFSSNNSITEISVWGIEYWLTHQLFYS